MFFDHAIDDLWKGSLSCEDITIEDVGVGTSIRQIAILRILALLTPVIFCP